ncbi:peptidoglycan/LPS O-acetylase OafA/YrhL [Xanthomonas arboricola]
MSIYLVSLVSTLAVFCATTWQLLHTFHAGERARDRAAWALRGACLIGLAVGMLGIFLHDLAQHTPAPWYVLLVRGCLTVLLIYPCRRRESAR